MSDNDYEMELQYIQELLGEIRDLMVDQLAFQKEARSWNCGRPQEDSSEGE